LAKKAWEMFPNLIGAVRKSGVNFLGGSHDLLHDLMVAAYCLQIGDGRDAELATAAALIHSTDRRFEGWKAREILEGYLMSENCISPTERNAIVWAVLHHSEPNNDGDSMIAIILKDADRLANLGPNMILRSPQHYNKLPVCDPKFVKNPDPEATYKIPLTVLHDIRCALEWTEGGKFGIRLPKARKLARKYTVLIEDLISVMQLQLEETKLYPPPDFLYE